MNKSLSLERKTKKSMTQVKGVVKKLMKEFGGNDLKASWINGGKTLKMALYGYSGTLVLKPGIVQISLRPPKSSSMPAALIRRELETALKKICA